MTCVHLAYRMQCVVVLFAEIGDLGGEGFVQKILHSIWGVLHLRCLQNISVEDVSQEIAKKSLELWGETHIWCPQRGESQSHGSG